MGLVHCHVLGFDGDVFVFNGASDGVTENNDPLSGFVSLFGLGNEHAVFAASDNLLQSAHVLDVFLVDGCVPEDDAHVLALGFLECKDECAVEVRPKILGLDVGEEDV